MLGLAGERVLQHGGGALMVSRGGTNEAWAWIVCAAEHGYFHDVVLNTAAWGDIRALMLDDIEKAVSVRSTGSSVFSSVRVSR